MKESVFKFRNPVLESIRFDINDEFNEEEYDGVGISGETLISRMRDKNMAVVRFYLKIGENAQTVPFVIEISMKAEYQWEESMEEEKVKKLLQSNAPALILSYMRPIVANITGSSKYPMFHIPYIDLSENEAVFEEIGE